jgi:hypothetical protein
MGHRRLKALWARYLRSFSGYLLFKQVFQNSAKAGGDSAKESSENAAGNSGCNENRAEAIQMNHRTMTGLALLAAAVAMALAAPAAIPPAMQTLAGRYPLRSRTSDFYSRARPDGLSAQKSISKRTPINNASR